VHSRLGGSTANRWASKTTTFTDEYIERGANMSDIYTKLDQLAELNKLIEKLKSDKREIISKVLSPEILSKLDEIDLEFSEKEKGLNENIEKLEAEIRTDTQQLGKSISSSGYIAMWSKGRTTWDNKGLASYSEKHPEILEYRKESQPIVSIRKINEKK
jgi:hypothetical protein